MADTNGRWARWNFIRDEAGNITVFSVFMLVLILGITGASVDLMRFEAVRATMQTTMDRAVLAAADLDQQQDANTVVRDYLAKAGIEAILDDVDPDEGLNYRTVSASGHADLDTFFLKMMGMNQLTAPASATAEERISHVEISMVLDVSGSMSGSRLTNMQAAAREFVDTVIQPTNGDSGEGLTTVSLVPYNATVNLGDTVGAYFNLDADHGYSNCATFPGSAYDTVAVDPATRLEKIAHFDVYNRQRNGAHKISDPWCDTGDSRAVMVHSADRDALKTRINSLWAQGNTAIDLGVKWGAALLDEDMNDLVTNMNEDGLVIDAAADRPAGYDDEEAIKFIVVMTDGENTSQYDLRDKYKTGMSYIWVEENSSGTRSDDRYSARVRDWSGTSNDVWYWPDYDTYRNYPRGGSDARQLTWPEVFERFPTSALAPYFLTDPYYDRYISSSDWYDLNGAYETRVNGDMADDRLSRICRAAREEGIVIFAIAFEAPNGGKQALKDCASSPSHYFDVEGVEITETFHAIARQINSLRLIQ